MKRLIRKAVIPAAGNGTRMLPATRIVPKELLPVAGKPLIQYAVEEAAASGIEEVILVLAKGKESIAEHLQADAVGFPEIDGGEKTSVYPKIQIAWQQSPRGLADAILAASPMINNEPFAVILPDVLIDAEVPCTAQLMAAYEERDGCIIATREIPPEQIHNFGVLKIAERSDKSGTDKSTHTSRISSLVERPTQINTSPPYGIFGRYILPPEIFDCIRATQPGLHGELQLTDSLQLLTGRVPVFGFLFDGEHYDAGSHAGLLEASVAFGLKNPQMNSLLREHLAHLVLRAPVSSVNIISVASTITR